MHNSSIISLYLSCRHDSMLSGLTETPSPKLSNSLQKALAPLGKLPVDGQPPPKQLSVHRLN